MHTVMRSIKSSKSARRTNPTSLFALLMQRVQRDSGKEIKQPHNSIMQYVVLGPAVAMSHPVPAACLACMGVLISPSLPSGLGRRGSSCSRESHTS